MVVIRKRLAIYLNRFTRGSFFLGIFLSLFTVAGLSKILGIDMSVIVLWFIATFGYFGGCYIIGYLDERYGIWGHQLDHNLEVQNKGRAMYDKIDYIYRKMGGDDGSLR